MRSVRRLQNSAKIFLVQSRRWVLLGCMIVLVTVFAALLFSPLTRVREIRIVRTDTRVDIRKVLEHVRPLYGQHLFFLSSSDISSLVREAVPDVQTVAVHKEYPSRLGIRLVLLPLIARLKIESPVPQGKSGSGAGLTGSGALARGKMYDFLAQNGMYVVSPDEQKDAPLPTIRIVDWGARPIPNTRLINAELLEQMNRAEQALVREFGQQIKSRTVFLRAREFHLDTPQRSYWFDMRSPMEEQLGRLRSFLRAAKLQDVKSYIDLRVEGRVMYK